VTAVDAPATNGVQPLAEERHPDGTVELPASQPATNGSSTPLGAGAIVEGTVSGITHFGAFVALEGGATGLVHISEIAYEYVRDVRDHLTVNDRVKVKVLQVNPANGKYDLSLKQTLESPPEVTVHWRRGRREKTLPEGADPAFEEKLSKFLKSSEERLLDVKRNLESKRGGRYR
jgi:S1 RNA binding domain protein